MQRYQEGNSEQNETVHDNRSESFVSHLTPKEHERLINQVGRRCTVKGKLNGKMVEILWDTGAQSIYHFSGLSGRQFSERRN